MIWSLRTRVIHWLIALPVLGNFVLEGGDISHKVLGYSAMGMMLVRVLWGLVAKDHAHFSAFPFGQVFRPQTNYPGHTPIASWVYVFIWLLVGALGITGFMMSLDRFWGEEWLENIHTYLSNTLMILVLIHLLGVFFDSWRFRRRTWMGMINGRRE